MAGRAVCVILDTTIWNIVPFVNEQVIPMVQALVRQSPNDIIRFLLIEVGNYAPYHRFVTRASPFTVDIGTFISWLQKVTPAGVPGQGCALADTLVVAGAALKEARCQHRHCIVAGGSRPVDIKARCIHEQFSPKALTCDEAIVLFAQLKIYLSIIMNRFEPKLLQLFRNHSDQLKPSAGYNVTVSGRRDPSHTDVISLLETVHAIVQVKPVAIEKPAQNIPQNGVANGTSKRRRSSGISGKNSRQKSGNTTSPAIPATQIPAKPTAKSARGGSRKPGVVAVAAAQSAFADWFEKSPSWIGQVVLPEKTTNRPLCLAAYRELRNPSGNVPLPWGRQLSWSKTDHRNTEQCRRLLDLAKQKRRLLKIECSSQNAPSNVKTAKQLDTWRESQRKLYTDLVGALEARALVGTLTTDKTNAPIVLFSSSAQGRPACLLGAFLGEDNLQSAASSQHATKVATTTQDQRMNPQLSSDAIALYQQQLQQQHIAQARQQALRVQQAQQAQMQMGYQQLITPVNTDSNGFIGSGTGVGAVGTNPNVCVNTGASASAGVGVGIGVGVGVGVDGVGTVPKLKSGSKTRSLDKIGDLLDTCDLSR